MKKMIGILAALALTLFLYATWQGPAGTADILEQISEASGAVRTGPVGGHDMDGTLPELSQANFEMTADEAETRSRLLDGCRAVGLSPIGPGETAFGLPTMCEGQVGDRSTSVHFDTECAPASCKIRMAVSQI